MDANQITEKYIDKSSAYEQFATFLSIVEDVMDEIYGFFYDIVNYTVYENSETINCDMFLRNASKKMIRISRMPVWFYTDSLNKLYCDCASDSHALLHINYYTMLKISETMESDVNQMIYKCTMRCDSAFCAAVDHIASNTDKSKYRDIESIIKHALGRY